MKGSMCSVGGLLLFCAMTTGPAFAQLGQKVATPVPGATQRAQVERPVPQPTGSPRADARRHAAQLSKLYIAMKKKLSLSSTQEKAIERLFRRHIAVLNGGRGAGRSLGVRGSDAAELASLRERLQAARKAGDERALRRLRQEFREKIAKRSTASALSTDDFLAKVSAHLSGDQQAEFRELERTMRSRDRRGRSGTGELRKFWRVVSSPAVGLSSEQRRTATGIMRDGVADLSQAQKDGLDGAPIIAALRRDVLEQLSSKQRVKVEIALGLRPKTKPAPEEVEPEAVVKLVAEKSEDARSEAKPQVKAESEPKAEPVEEPRAEGKDKPETKPAPTPKAEPKPVPVTKVEPKPAPKEEAPKEPSGESKPEPKPKPAAKPEPPPKAEKDTGADEESNNEEAPDKENDDG